MSSRSLRQAMSLCVALLMGLTAVSCGSSSDDAQDATGPESSQQQSPADKESAQPDTGPEANVIAITVRGGEVKTAEELVELSLGDPVRIEVTSDVSDEVHVHGYERKVDVKAGKTAVIKFNADIPGTFEVELDDAGLELVQLRVR